jgi:hypothetical protein
LSQAQDLKKSIAYWLKPVPADEGEAMIRDALDDIPIIGDLFYRLAETIVAIQQGDSFAAMVYGANLLLPFDIPFTHMLVYEVEGKRQGEK